MRIGLFGAHTGLAGPVGDAGVTAAVHDGSLDDAKDPGFGERLHELFSDLDQPRLFLLDLPVGPAIDRVIDAAYVMMEPGDVVIDTSPSYWCDSLRRYRRMRHRSLFYVDVALLGPSLPCDILASGDDKGVALARPLLERLAPRGGVVQAGSAGAAHFARTVRAGLAMAVAHAQSEARQLLEAYPAALDAAAVAERFWPAMPAATPDAAWLADDAIRLHAAIPLLAQAVMLELGQSLDCQQALEVPPRVGGFVHPDEIL